MADLESYKPALGSTTYYVTFNNLLDFLEPFLTEIEDGRNGQASLNAIIDLCVKTTGLLANLSAGGFKITSLADPVDATDAANKQWVAGQILGGGAPSDIPVTSLDNGTATAGQVLRINSGGTAPEGFDILNYQVKTGAYTAVSGDQLACDTTGGAFTVTLPASPTDGKTKVSFLDHKGNFATASLTIGRNGNPIMGLAEDMTVSTNNAAFELLYINSTDGWRII